ncbi:FKBP-type peptidyl-prolyl cis-trans isomerase [Gordonia sp. HY285]|uniref:FKBP-type peptidyl-prolyl cis-trans isomerase n=1 Tax=Gordonia liuliyuniae TaxID=2911517 RepID=UPI001F00685C|nr:FKBP-type peptidyl-prolyl cis-trans isomerase [Gordonia liuliyuniae]MCF8611316.1 FKBP-type peptidyl-prolyl cis-trans isomerase [Gordonia liuliyuniae]
MTLTTKFKPLILIPAALTAFTLAACSSDDDSSDALSCPKDVPAAGTKADWTLPGKTGSLAVVAPTDDTAPLITVNGPFTVDETTVKTLKEGDGDEVTEAMDVQVCYQGVNGRDGNTFDNAFERGEPAKFNPTAVVPGFSKALVGQKIGSTVAVAMTPTDGYGPTGNEQAKIQGDDTLIFALTIVDGY